MNAFESKTDEQLKEEIQSEVETSLWNGYEKMQCFTWTQVESVIKKTVDTSLSKSRKLVQGLREAEIRQSNDIGKLIVEKNSLQREINELRGINLNALEALTAAENSYGDWKLHGRLEDLEIVRKLITEQHAREHVDRTLYSKHVDWKEMSSFHAGRLNALLEVEQEVKDAMKTESTHMSLCSSCWCMTYTVASKCGKCGVSK